MVDVLLTHSYHLPYDRKQARKMTPYPPLATLYAAALLRHNGFSVTVFDTMLQEPESGFRQALRVHQPRVVAIYEDDFNFLTKMCLTRMRELAWQMAQAAKRAGAIVIAHGSDATDHPAEYLKEGCDFVVAGEAESKLLKLVAEITQGTLPLDLPGGRAIARADCGDAARHSVRTTPRDAVSLLAPARDLIDLSPYREAWKRVHGFFSLNLVASRGCPFRCNWCAKPAFGDSYQVRPARDVAAEMLQLRDQFGADHLWFADDIFALNRHWIQEFADAVGELGCAVPFKIQARADLLSAETVRALKRAGCVEVWMGVESGSQKILDAMEKGLRVEQVSKAREHLKSEGIRACYFLQFGYPGELWEDIQKTVELVRRTRPDDIGVSFSYPLPNTRFYERVREQLGGKQNWSDSEDLCVMFRGTYTDIFYRAVRDALHAEVESWRGGTSSTAMQGSEVASMWCSVEKLEGLSRNSDATKLPPIPVVHRPDGSLAGAPFVHLSFRAAAGGEFND